MSMNVIAVLQGQKEAIEVNYDTSLEDLKNRISEEFGLKCELNLYTADGKVEDLSSLVPDVEIEVETNMNVWGSLYINEVGNNGRKSSNLRVKFCGERNIATFFIGLSSFEITDLHWKDSNTMHGMSSKGNQIVYNFNTDKSIFTVGSQKFVLTEN